MIVLDASAIIAILGREDDADALTMRLQAANRPFLVSPATLFEAVIGLSAKKARANRVSVDAELIDKTEQTVRAFLVAIGAQEVAITPAMGRAAIEAAKRYGRVVGSLADLNFGDCLAYACAAEHGAALLYKGNDFAQTDLA